MEAHFSDVTTLHKETSMNSFIIKPVKLSSTILAVFVIVISTISAESICHAFSHNKLFILGDNYHFIVPAAAVFVTFLILSLLLRTKHLSIEFDTKDKLNSDELWERTFNTMADFVSVHDKDFKVIKANHALCEFLGKSHGEIAGKFCYQLFHNINEPFINCPHKKTSEIGDSVTEIITDSNIGVPLQITCSPLFDDDGVFQGSVHIARVHEITGKQKKKAEMVIPICASCKNIRNTNNEWASPEDYFVKKYGCQFTHTVCKDCQAKLYPEYTKF